MRGGQRNPGAQDAALREAQAQLAEQQQRQARALEALRGQMHDVLGLAIAEARDQGSGTGGG